MSWALFLFLDTRMFRSLSITRGRTNSSDRLDGCRCFVWTWLSLFLLYVGTLFYVGLLLIDPFVWTVSMVLSFFLPDDYSLLMLEAWHSLPLTRLKDDDGGKTDIIC
jgi:hypothetical protein